MYRTIFTHLGKLNLELQHEGVMVDVLYDGQEFTHITGPLIQTENVHGTGCTLSTAIACELSKGYTVLQVISRYPYTYTYRLPSLPSSY